MKKLLPLLLALSLAANAALVVTHFIVNPSAASTNPAKISSGATTAKTATSAATLKAAAKIPTDTELATLQDRLIEAGCTPEIARDVLRAMLWRPLHERQRAMLEAKNAGKPYWQQTGSNKKQLTADERAELRTLSEQIEARAASVLGNEYGNKATSRYPFLSPDKAAALAKLHRDYGDMQDGVSDETSLFRLPSDDAGKKLLRQEQRHDLESILSPAELADYDLHYSAAAYDLRKRFSALPDSTETEYKAAYDIAQTLNASKGDLAAQNLAAQQLRDLLGPDRYTAFLRANDSDYTALQGAAARFDIPAATIDKVYGLRDQAVSLSQQIAADKNLSAKDKQQALKTLSNQLRTDVRTNLGDEIGKAYLDQNMSWLKSLAAGNTLNATPTGKITTKPISSDGGKTNASGSGLKNKSPNSSGKPAKDKSQKKGK